MLRIRLTRKGFRKQPHYRVVVADQRAPRDGAFVDIIGHFNPRTGPDSLTVDQDKAREWLGKGAQPSEAVAKLFRRQGIIPPA
jgi:small subunit ribosomal protein S16